MGQGDLTTLTWSIVPDGTEIPALGGIAAESSDPSDLVSFMRGIYGVTETDTVYTDAGDAAWFSHFESTFDRWSDLTGITYVYEPNDDGAAFTNFSSSAPGVLGVRGDARIGGHFIDGNSNVLAYNFFPSHGEMVIDTGDNFYSSTFNNSIRLRNTLSHEAGHGIGLRHVESDNAAFLMEPFISTSFDGPQFDDILGAQRHYGDNFEPNDSSATAFGLGSLSVGQTLSIGGDATDTVVAATDTSLVSIDGGADSDFYSFSVTEAVTVDLTLTPLGPTYNQGPQGGSQSPLDTAALSDLALELRDTDGAAVLASANLNPAGQDETISFSLLTRKSHTVNAQNRLFVRKSFERITYGNSRRRFCGDRVSQTEVVRREVSAAFDGGKITSDGGGLLLREVEERFGILRSFTAGFTDHRSDYSEFSVGELLRQRVMGIALGYEDLNDHERLRHDPLLALMCGRRDITGQDRTAECKGVPLAGKSTLNRLELTPVGATKDSRYKKIVASIATLQDTFVDVFIRLRSKQTVPTELVLDLDATDDPVHGDQLGKFFHGYYKSYCFLPLYTFCDGWPLGAILRPSNIDGCAGTVKELERIVPKLRAAWPAVKIIIRADSGFCRDHILRWCEENNVDYIVGLAKNKRLVRAIGGELQQALEQLAETGTAARVFKDFRYRTKKSWSCERRVIGKAEHLFKGANPRFVVTSLSAERVDARTLYEDRYCARGEMENRIKEQQLYLFADRTSTHNMRSNQLRLLFSTMAYLLHHVLREFGLAGTEMQNAQAGTIRSKLLKIGAKIQVSVRRVVISLSESYPYQQLFERVLANLRRQKTQVLQV